MYDILSEYSDIIERYSVDECFLDFTASVGSFGDPVNIAYEIKDRIKEELGFTVNIGVSVNKILAKMGSEMKKPDRVHTLYPEEISEKMWPLDVRELFFCGRATERKLKNIGVKTIGQIAATDLKLLQAVLKPVHGKLIYEYANGIDETPVRLNNTIVQKGVGNSTTIAYDVTNTDEAYQVILALSERIGYRLRKLRASAQVVSVTIRNNELFFYRHQMRTEHPIDTTTEIYEYAQRIFIEMWHGDPIRHIGINLAGLTPDAFRQITFFDREDEEKLKIMDKTIDGIRNRYGDEAITRGVFTNTDVPFMQGGVNDGNYLMMGGYSL
jgi:DNA polymerase-4